MITTKKKLNRRRQEGIVLLMLIVVMAVAISVFYFSTISIEGIKLDKLDDTRQALKKAKQSLLDYAVLHSGVSGDPGEYGYLPCPDNFNITAEGQQELTCGILHVNSIGHLPWKSLGIAPIKDSSGNCLWYAVSGSYKNHPNSGLINEDTQGLFQVGEESDVVAVIFSPGSVLADQERNFDSSTLCGGDSASDITTIPNYLEGDGVIDNATLSGVSHQVDTFIQRSLTSDSDDVPYNDSLITVTREEIWRAVWKAGLEQELIQVTEALATCLAAYANHLDNPNRRLPFPALMAAGDYRDNMDYSDVITGYTGRFPYHIDDSNTALITGTIIDDFINDPMCSNLTLAVSGLSNIDLTDEDSLHRKIYNNWKDHFFYAVSKGYAFPDVAYTGCTVADCVSVGATEYAGIVFYGGSPYETQSRIYEDPPGTDDKADVTNYLENGNDAVFILSAGDGLYSPADPDPTVSNDVMFCLTNADPPMVIRC